MPCDLIFIEKKSDIPLLNGLVNDNSKILCINPTLQVELTKKGIQYKNSIDFFGVNGHKATLKFSNEIVEKIRPYLKNLSDEKFCKSYEKNWIFKFRFYLHQWVSSLHIIDSAVQKYCPDRLVIFGSYPNNFNKSKKNIESLINRVIIHYSKANLIQIHIVKNRTKYCFINWQKIPLIRSFIKNLLFRFLLIIYPLVIKKRSPVLVPDDTYNMPRFLNDVCQNLKDPFPIYLQTRKINLLGALKEIVKGNLFSFVTIPESKDLKKNLIFEKKLNSFSDNIANLFNNYSILNSIYGVNLSQPLLRFINNEMTYEMKVLYRKLISLQKVLDIVKPNYVFAQHSLGISYALGEYCSENSIPSLLISHGSHVPHSDSIAEIEWAIHAQTIFNSDYPFAALQTPWASKFLYNQVDRVTRGIETGPLLFAKKSNDVSSYRTRKQLFKNYRGQKVLLHASTPKDWKNFRPWVYETFDEYIRNINDVIEAVEKNNNLFLAIRYRPIGNMSLLDFKSLLKPGVCYSVCSDGSFEEYLNSSDLLISYSSTAIEESLQNYIPVLQYDPDGKYTHLPGQNLSAKSNRYISSVYFSHSKKSLYESLKWWDINHDNAIVDDWSQHITKNDSNMAWIKSLS